VTTEIASQVTPRFETPASAIIGSTSPGKCRYALLHESEIHGTLDILDVLRKFSA
jgi:hypothetical protein